jgi:recombinational DNA repair protein RecR
MIIVIKSNRVIAKQLQSKLKKASNITLIVNRETAWISFCNEQIKQNIVNILSNYKRQKFEICTFTEKQLGLTLYKKGLFNVAWFYIGALKLPLKKRFLWYNNDIYGHQAITPITNKQFNNIIKIN